MSRSSHSFTRPNRRIATARRCCGQVWYPLFPRKTNASYVDSEVPRKQEVPSGPHVKVLVMFTRAELVAELATIVADYRRGDVPTMDSAHVERWLKQFNPSVQDPLLAEMVHVLGKTYISRDATKGFLAKLVTNASLAGSDPASFWANSVVRNIQLAGSSQRDLLEVFGEVLKDQLGVALGRCPQVAERIIYIDDGVFSGTRTQTDLCAWIERHAPPSSNVYVITMAMHSGGQWFAKGRIEKAAKTAVKRVTTHWWRSVELENRLNYRDTSDVLWPARLPTDAAVEAYAKSLEVAGFPPAKSLRSGNSVGSQKIFSTHSSRDLLEQEFLKKGTKIRHMCINLPTNCRPLGFSGLKTFGFGSTFVTYRNCPNTTPLAFWVGAPWYPLFPRKTNTESGRARQF